MGYYVQIHKTEVRMTKEEAKKAIQELSRKIEYHSRKYYVEDSPEISDFEYDKMFQSLKSTDIRLIPSVPLSIHSKAIMKQTSLCLMSITISSFSIPKDLFIQRLETLHLQDIRKMPK